MIRVCRKHGWSCASSFPTLHAARIVCSSGRRTFLAARESMTQKLLILGIDIIEKKINLKHYFASSLWQSCNLSTRSCRTCIYRLRGNPFTALLRNECITIPFALHAYMGRTWFEIDIFCDPPVYTNIAYVHLDFATKNLASLHRLPALSRIPIPTSRGSWYWQDPHGIWFTPEILPDPFFCQEFMVRM